MGNFSRDSRDTRGDRGGGRSFGRSSFGGNSFNRGGNRSSDRPMFKTICSNCGKECEVPFRPTNGKPVYCSECFEKMGNTRSDSPRGDFGRDERPSFNRPQAPVYDQSRAQLDAINVKLERILKILETKIPTPAVVAQVTEEVKEVVAPKVEKKVRKSPIKK